MTRTTTFEKNEIIEKAMNLFWEKGYQATSLNDLIQVTGLHKGSLYNTFESKENLFLLCLEKYGNYSSSFFYKSGDPTNYLQVFFKRLIREGIKPENKKGCLIMNSCLEFSKSEDQASTKTKELFQAIEDNFENVVREITKGSATVISEHKTNLSTAAFAIREISKFKKNKNFLRQIANNALKDLKVQI